MALALTSTAVVPGQQGNLIQISFIPVADASTIALAVIESDFSQYVIQITAGYNAGTGFLNVANWAAVAAQMNADPAVAALTSSVGTANDGVPPAGTSGFSGGSAGGGQGSYFFSVGAPPPAPASVNTTAQNDGSPSGGFSRCAADARQRRSYAPWRPRKVKC